MKAMKFEDDSRVATRALQAYMVLIGQAWEGKTLTYGDLSQNQMEYGNGGIIDRVLGCIMGWCEENGLPPLTVLVVNAETGAPGQGLVTVSADDCLREMRRVHQFNWFSLMPPSIEALEAGGQRYAAGS